MSIEKHKSRLKDHGPKTATVEIKPHPKEILDLDEETVAIARAKLAGVDFDEIYGDEDRSSPELLIRTQAKKIRELFHSPSEVRRAFSSEQKIREAHKDLKIDGIDIDFVRQFCQTRQAPFSDDADALIFVGFDEVKSGEPCV